MDEREQDNSINLRSHSPLSLSLSLFRGPGETVQEANFEELLGLEAADGLLVDPKVQSLDEKEMLKQSQREKDKVWKRTFVYM